MELIVKEHKKELPALAVEFRELWLKLADAVEHPRQGQENVPDNLVNDDRKDEIDKVARIVSELDWAIFDLEKILE